MADDYWGSPHSLITRVRGLREFIKLRHGRKITNIREQLIFAAEVSIEDQAEGIDRGNCRIKLFIVAGQVIGIQNPHPFVPGLEPGTMIALEDNDRRSL
jgi:hypothetical protein